MLDSRAPRATRVRALMGCWPGTDLRVCLKCRLQILCTKSLQEYPWPQESLSDFLQLSTLLSVPFLHAHQSSTFVCDTHQTQYSNERRESAKMPVLSKSNINTDVRNSQLLLKENSSMDVTLFTYISHKLPCIHLTPTQATYEAENGLKEHISTGNVRKAQRVNRRDT